MANYIDSHNMRYDSRVTDAFVAAVQKASHAQNPADWAVAVYELLGVPRLATYTPKPAIPGEHWVENASSYIGSLQLIANVQQEALWLPAQYMRQLMPEPGNGHVLPSLMQPHLAQTLFDYVSPQFEYLHDDVLLPVLNEPNFLVLHVEHGVAHATQRYEWQVEVRRAVLVV